MFGRAADKIVRALASNKFFWIIIALFLVQAIWMALTASYPMAFDENFHFGIIQIYAHQWSPILTVRPANSAQYGELLHDPSYLFQYLMSFPYRLTALFTHNQVIQIIVLRLIDIAFFAAGLYFFRKLLRKVGLSSALTNFALLMLIMIPVTSFLAATINYDNLLFLTVPVYLLLVIRCLNAIKNHHVQFSNLAWVIIVGTLGSLVKYAFLPIFAITVIYLSVVWFKNKPHRHLLASVSSSFKAASVYVKIGLLVLLVISIGLFLQRYAVNLVQYHNVQPDCSKIESVNDCLQYGPWARNYNAEIKAQLDGTIPYPALPLFLPYWFGGMVYRLYFAINSNYMVANLLPIPIVLASAVGLLGMVLSVVFWRSITKSIRRYAWLILLTILAYVASLLYVNFSEYLRFDEMVAINGRYLIALLPLMFVFFGLAFRQLIIKLAGRRATLVKVCFAVLVTITLLQGGGILAFLIGSNASWYWPHDPLTGFNLAIQNIAKNLVIGGH